MNQKKHLNAIAALEASKDAEPGSLWNGDWCQGFDCDRCYADEKCNAFVQTGDRRAALQSGLDAYHKRKAEKAERRAAEAAIPFPRDPDAETKPLIPDPPDTPEVRKQMEAWAAWKDGDISPCCKSGEDWFCESDEASLYFNTREDVRAFALSWLSRHPAKWDAEKGRFTLAERHARMRKWAEAVIKHYPIPDEDAATVWQAGMMDSRLLADEVIAYLAEEARRQGWKR